MNNTNPVSRRGPVYEREPAGISRVIIPPGVDRERYIKHCYQCSTISMISRTNLDIVHDVQVDCNTLQQINFPNTTEELGSTVIWVNLPIYNTPVVVGVLYNSDQMGTQLKENEFNFTKFTPEGEVSISGKCSGSRVDVVAKSLTEKGGHLSINVSNKDSSSVLDVVVNGNFYLKSINSELSSRDSFSIEVQEGLPDSKPTYVRLDRDSIESRVKDSSSGYRVEEDKFTIGKGKEFAVLAHPLEEFLHSFIDTVATQTVATALGPQPLMNAAGISSLKSQTSTFISKYLKVE